MESKDVRAAASSIASGTLPSLLQSLATSSSPSSGSGVDEIVLARSVNKRPALAMGPNLNTYSPSKCNGSRLVTNMRVLLLCVITSRRTPLTSLSRCSALSTTSNAGFWLRRLVIVVSNGSVRTSRTPSASATAVATRLPSCSPLRSTNQAPPGNWSMMSDASCSARRVFPMPPMPTIVMMARSLTRLRSSSSSSSRPTNVEIRDGRLFGCESTLVSAGNSGRSSGPTT